MGKKMTFTADDVKRLKELAFKEIVKVEIDNVHLQALVARLEAAELCLIDSGITEEKCHYDHHGNCQAHFVSDPCPVKAWLKVCGRE